MTDTAKAVAEGRRTTPLEAELAALSSPQLAALKSLHNVALPFLPGTADEVAPAEPVDALIGNELAGQYGGWWE